MDVVPNGFFKFSSEMANTDRYLFLQMIRDNAIDGCCCQCNTNKEYCCLKKQCEQSCYSSSIPKIAKTEEYIVHSPRASSGRHNDDS